jgi:MFS transporter, DHA1 family, tetracycline resistance protein
MDKDKIIALWEQHPGVELFAKDVEAEADTIQVSQTASPARGVAVAFIFVTILLDMLALGLIMPILPKLVESFLDNDTARAARIFGLFGTAWALMQFFFSPILGALSDRFGRRPVVLLSNFGLGLDYVLMALAPSLIWLFVGRVISGITSASVSTAFAYIADVTSPEKRAAAFGKVGAAFGAGFILGPAIGGLLGGIDPRLPFWAAAGLSFANTLYGLLILPESLPHDRRSPFRWQSANPIGALHLLRSNRVIAGLSVVNFFAQLAHVVLPSTFVLYATYRYGWNAATVGLTLAMVGICAMAVQGVAIGPIVRHLGERRALMLGLGCAAAGFLIFGIAPTGPLSWLGIPVMALWGVSGAALQALNTQLVKPEHQGRLQGATSSVQSVSQLLGPFLFTLTFAYFIGADAPMKLPGAPFLLAAALLLLALAIAVRTLVAARVRRTTGRTP